MHVNGTYIFANGDKYVGEFNNDKMNGHGTYTIFDGQGLYDNGGTYVGSYKNGVRDQGTIRYPNGLSCNYRESSLVNCDLDVEFFVNHN
jgi:hypothetical protein